MHDTVLVTGSCAAVIGLFVGLRTVQQREPLWQLLSGFQFGLVGMMILLVVSNSARSTTLDLIDMVYGCVFVGYALYVWNVQMRSAREQSDHS